MSKINVYFDRFVIELTQEQAETGAHEGQCYEDVQYLLTLPEIAAQLDKLPPEDIKAELKPYGAWDDIELLDDRENRARLLWIACGNAREELRGKG